MRIFSSALRTTKGVQGSKLYYLTCSTTIDEMVTLKTKDAAELKVAWLWNMMLARDDDIIWLGKACWREKLHINWDYMSTISKLSIQGGVRYNHSQ